MKTLSNKHFEKHIETIGVENIDVSDYININNEDYVLTEEQEERIMQIQDELHQEQVSEDMQFHKDCHKYSEVGF